MAQRIVNVFARKLPRHIQRDDLLQAAYFGLLDGLRRYPERVGPEHDGYLCLRIRGEIIDELRRHEDGKRRRDRGTLRRTVGLSELGDNWEDKLPGPGESPETVAIQRLDAERAWRAPLSPAEHRILRARYELNRKQDDIALTEGVSAPRVSQQEAHGLIAMRCYLTGEMPALTLSVATREALERIRRGR